MFPIDIKFILTHPKAVLPTSNHSDPFTGDTGLDVTAVETTVIPGNSWAIVPVGLKLAYITPGYWFKVEGRSGLGFKKHLFPHFGVIDNGYRGDMGIKIYNFGSEFQTIMQGDKVAQLVIYPLIQANVHWSTEASESERGDKGFGSSDKLLPGELAVNGTIAQL